MSLLAGYESSDDESGPSVVKQTSSLPPASTVDDDNDAEIEEQARADAFGLATSSTSRVAKVETRVRVAAAPEVLKEDPNAQSNALIARPTDQVINVNLTYEDMTRPVQGPENPFDQQKNKGMNSLAGGCLLAVSSNPRPY